MLHQSRAIPVRCPTWLVEPLTWLARGVAWLTCAAALSVTGCGGHGAYVWYSQLPASDLHPRVGEYSLKPGDTISVRVFGQESLSAPSKVRSDGRISLPFAGEVVAAGKHPLQLATEIEGRLKVFIVSPRVSVGVEQSAPISVSLLGEVTNAGTVSLEPPATLVQALAQAGGLSEFADDTAIFVLRRQPSFRRIRFTYEALLRNDAGAGAFPLRAGDVIVVE